MMQDNFEEVSKNRYKELSSFFISLLDKGIPYAVIKGEPLSILAYGKAGQRYSGDVDILVSTNDIEKINLELSTFGFKPRTNERLHQVIAISSTHQAIDYIKELDGKIIEVDINHDIFWGEYTGKRINVEELLSDTIEMIIYSCKIKTISPLKAMVQLILHHYHELNSIFHLSIPNCIHQSMFKDVYYLWNNNKELITNNLYEISCAYEIIPYAYYVLYYTNKIFNDSCLEKLINSFETSEGKALLNCYGLTDEERKEWKVDFSTRLDEENVFQYIEDDLTAKDIEKLNRTYDVFK